MKTLLIVALAAALAGCSRQPPLPPADPCTGWHPFGCRPSLAKPPMPLARAAPPAERRAVAARRAAKLWLAHVRHRTPHVAAKGTTPAAVTAKTEALASHAQLPTAAPGNPALAADAAVKPPEGAVAQASAAPPRKSLQEQVAVATADTARAPANADLLVAVVLARQDVKSVADLRARDVAIDDRYASSSTSVRTAIVAAGAPEVQLSQGQATAVNRLVNGEVAAAVVALEQPEAAESFPEIEGYRIFHIPLSPSSMKAMKARP